MPNKEVKRQRAGLTEIPERHLCRMSSCDCGIALYLMSGGLSRYIAHTVTHTRLEMVGDVEICRDWSGLRHVPGSTGPQLRLSRVETRGGRLAAGGGRPVAGGGG